MVFTKDMYGSPRASAFRSAVRTRLVFKKQKKKNKRQKKRAGFLKLTTYNYISQYMNIKRIIKQSNKIGFLIEKHLL